MGWKANQLYRHVDHDTQYLCVFNPDTDKNVLVSLQTPRMVVTGFTPECSWHLFEEYDGLLYTVSPTSLDYSSNPTLVSKPRETHTPIEYKYDEAGYSLEVKQYIDDTYSEHYATGKLQATEVIIDGGHGESFCVGNILKYASRYGHKEGRNRKDIMKIIHYAFILLFVHDRGR